MSKNPPRDWRERWQPFVIALCLFVGIVVISMLMVVGMELIRLKQQ